MKRKVNRVLIDAWIRSKERDGITQLANASKIPAGSLSKIRAGRVPQSALYRESLARVLGVEETVLFPVVKTEKSRAS